MGMNWVYLIVCLFIVSLRSCNGGISSRYVRRSNSISADMPLDSDVFALPNGYNAPQQVHITQGDHEGKGVIVSWVTPDEPGSSKVIYWAEATDNKKSAVGTVVTYKYYDYSSPYIHHCTIKNLEYDTKYFYEIGTENATRRFWFTTPPEIGPDVPYTFGLIGIVPYA